LDDPGTAGSDRERVQVCRMMMVTMTEANMRLDGLDRRPRRAGIRGRGDRAARRPRG
jgi:hypothetical protein